MPDFPAVIPDASRTHKPGLFGSELYQHPGGVEVRFLASIVPIASSLSLSFNLRDEATVELIRNHFISQEGGTLPFALSNELLAGFPSGDLLAPLGFAWVYAKPISIEQAAPKLFNITVELETAEVGAIAPGAIGLLIAASLQPGVVTVQSAGLSAVVSAAIQGGSATGSANMPGLNATVSATIQYGDIEVPGMSATVTMSLAAGIADNGVGGDYWADMSVQLYGTESLGYIEWWGN